MRGAVGAAVIGDDNLAGNVGLGDTFPSLSDANLKCVGFVEARHDDGNFGRAEIERVGRLAGRLGLKSSHESSLPDCTSGSATENEILSAERNSGQHRFHPAEECERFGKEEKESRHQ